METISLDLSKESENKLALHLKNKDLTLLEYVNDLIEQDLNSRVELGNGFYYDKNSEQLRDKENKSILITRIEKEMILTLIEFAGKIVPVDILTKRAWKKDNVSIFTFRNMIKKIRDKTYYEIIKNHSNLGYSINMRMD